MPRSWPRTALLSRLRTVLFCCAWGKRMGIFLVIFWLKLSAKCWGGGSEQSLGQCLGRCASQFLSAGEVGPYPPHPRTRKYSLRNIANPGPKWHPFRTHQGKCFLNAQLGHQSPDCLALIRQSLQGSHIPGQVYRSQALANWTRGKSPTKSRSYKPLSRKQRPPSRTSSKKSTD
jgi:hypothetical protein